MMRSRQLLKLLWALPVVSLLGCATAPFPPQAATADLGKLALNRQLAIMPNSARAFIQAGQLVTQPDSRDPVCVFESWRVSEQAQSVMPALFRLADISHRRGDVGSGFGVYGGTDMGMGIYFGSVGFGSPIYPSGVGRFDESAHLTQAATIVRLVSEYQPLIYKLTCFSAMSWAPFVEPPSANDMNVILGDIAHIELTTKE